MAELTYALKTDKRVISTCGDDARESLVDSDMPVNTTKKNPSVAEVHETVTSDEGFHDLLLKVTPPRAQRNLISRARLLASSLALQDYNAFLVQAPAGFGKTSLLAQWRHEYLHLGVVVAWISAQSTDSPRRLAQSLALAIRVAAARPNFGYGLLEAGSPGGLQNITDLLVELSQTALNTVIIVDEAEHLADESRDALAYLLRNAPANLRIIVAARADCHIGVDDLVDYGKCLSIGAETLRFRFDETLELVQNRFNKKISNDTAAKIHDLTEGWPLGLQLALTVVGSASDPEAELSFLSSHGSRLREHLVTRLLSNLAASDLEFLTRISILDLLHPELCQFVSGDQDARERLERMSLDTPVLVAAEQGDWLRMHALAREALQLRFDALPDREQKELHSRATHWLMHQGRVEPAAWHAMKAGFHEQACDLAERSLYDFAASIMTRGRLGVISEWISLLPSTMLDKRPRLLLAGAWALALSQRDEEAERQVERILAQSATNDEIRCECALILSGAALFADDPDRASALHRPWVDKPPTWNASLRQIHANRTAFCILNEGNPALARKLQQQASLCSVNELSSYLELWGEFHIAMTYVWEIQMQPAEQLLRKLLHRAESELGRRNPFACQVAAVLAAVVWEQKASYDAAILLANRLDVIERSALPACLLLAYRTLASIEISRKNEHRALELLEEIHAVATLRDLPRIRIASLGDQVRLHAHHFHAQTCYDLCIRIDAEIAAALPNHGPIWMRMVQGPIKLAWAYAAIAAYDWEAALEHITLAEQISRATKIGRLHIEAMALKAFILHRKCESDDTSSLLREAANLAATHGLMRVFDDAHPELGELVRTLDRPGSQLQTEAPLIVSSNSATKHSLAVTTTPSTQVQGSAALTVKEREVLNLLSQSMSNKEIGRVMHVGEETIKWHVKNLFFKLNATSRKHVVLRARILGFLPQVD